MIQIHLIAAAIQAVGGPASFAGFYDNPSKDVRLFLNTSGYSLETGSPLTMPHDQRHVDFESGFCDFSRQHLTLKRKGLFHSPVRLDYFVMMAGGLHQEYKRIFTTKEEQVRFLNELKWRLDKKAAKRTAILRTLQGKPEVVIDGIILKRAPWPTK